MIKRILVALAGTPHVEAEVQYGLDLAERHDAQITGVSILDLDELENVGPVPLGGGAAARDLAQHRVRATREAIEKSITTFEEACRARGRLHQIRRETGNAGETLLARWRYNDLTVFCSHGLFDYQLVDAENFIKNLVARGMRPLIAVPPQHREVRRAMIAYNGSMESAKAMKRFVQTAPWGRGVHLHLVCFDRDDDPRDGEALLDDATGYCEAHGYETTRDVVHAHPRETILPYATEQAVDAIVMGSTARVRILRRLLGDTVLECLRNSEIPLFLAQ